MHQRKAMGRRRIFGSVLRRARDNVRLYARRKAAFETSRQTYGSVRLTVVLRRTGEMCGRHQVAHLMRVQRLLAAQKCCFHSRTTDCRYLCPIRAQSSYRAGRPARLVRRGVARRHHLHRHAGGLALRDWGVLDACSRRVVRLGCRRRDAYRPGHPRFRANWAWPSAHGRIAPPLGSRQQHACGTCRELRCHHSARASMSRSATRYDNARMKKRNCSPKPTENSRQCRSSDFDCHFALVRATISFIARQVLRKFMRVTR